MNSKILQSAILWVALLTTSCSKWLPKMNQELGAAIAELVEWVDPNPVNGKTILDMGEWLYCTYDHTTLWEKSDRYEIIIDEFDGENQIWHDHIIVERDEVWYTGWREDWDWFVPLDSDLDKLLNSEGNAPWLIM